MNPIYIQLGIAVWLELARRRAEKKEDTEVSAIIGELIDNPHIKISDRLVKISIAEYLTDVAEDLLKMVKP